MSTTLTNGLKLPDKGSVDWYADMQNNYAILDGAVGTIAEHTTQIAGKAPAVHTHTKSDITDFPAYGNAAGTICEGNDSRLSDARTPVAHTHLTADVTDLLNTSHEWSKAQTYSDASAIIIKNNGVEIGNEPSAYNEQRFIFRDKNNQQIAAIKYQNQLSSENVFVNGLELSATDKFKDGVRDATGTAITAVLRIGLWNDGTKYIYNEGRWRSSLLPFTNNSYDLGSSSYQWNNLYAKNYYYNGTAWGLDKANTWSAVNQYSREIQLAGDRNSFIAPMWEGAGSGMAFLVSDASKAICFGTYTDDANNNNRKIVDGTKGRMIIRVGEKNSETYLEVEPRASNATLGNSSNKWKTFNGINPGALSLPDYDHPTFLDVSADGLNWHKDTTPNSYTMPVNGYFAVITQNPSISNAVLDIWVFNTGIGSSDHGTYTGSELFCYVPARTGQTIRVRARCNNYYSVAIYPAQGNV